MRASALLLISFSTIFAIHLATTVAYSQNLDQSKSKKLKKNTISAATSLHEFFDRSPIMQSYRPKGIGWTNLAFGLEYDRKLGRNHGFVVSSTLCAIRYGGRYLKKQGDVTDRGVWFFDAAYQHRLLSSAGSRLDGLCGVNFRYGFEESMAYWYGLETVTYNYELADFGLSFGVRGTQLLFSNFILTADLRYTQYVYVHSRFADQYGLVLHNRPTRNMLTMQLGLGYQF